MKKTETMWAIHGSCGLYVGTGLTRKEAIAKHIHGLGRTWDYFKKKGDVAVKVTMTYFLKKSISYE